MATTRTKSDHPSWRFRALAAGFMLLAFGLVVRLFSLQVLQYDSFTAKAIEQHRGVIVLPATRGDIRSSDGFNLATTQPAYMLTADPSLIKHPADAARQIADALYNPVAGEVAPPERPAASASAAPKPTPTPSFDQRVQTLTQQLSNSQSQYVVLAHKVSEPRRQKLLTSKVPALMFYPEPKRYYPEGTLASQVLGFVGADREGNDQGYYGIEGYFDRDLRGKDGKIYLEKDAAGNPIPVGKYQSTDMEQGATVTLTINRGLQYLLEQKLKTGVEQKKAESGSVILMEPDTGRILAMANYPTYNPNFWSDSDVQTKQLFRNSAVSDAYEPGSVMKSFTVATGLDLGLFGPDTTYQSAPYKVDDHTITTADNHYYGTATVTQMLEHSDNTGAAQFGLKIGRDKFLASLHKIGLDRPTGITLEGEGNSIIPDVNDWLKITLATASFGQGISVTPLQLLEMMQTIANHGVQMKPTIIQSMTHQGQTKTVEPDEVAQVFSAKAADQTTNMLEDVVKYGEFHRLALQGYHIAGKTSTAQIPLNGTYDANKTITTFVGYAPAQNPKFIMLVKLNKPQINNSAETVVPVWMDMATDIFTHFGIAPDPSSIPTPTPTPVP